MPSSFPDITPDIAADAQDRLYTIMGQTFDDIAGRASSQDGIVDLRIAADAWMAIVKTLPMLSEGKANLQSVAELLPAATTAHVAMLILIAAGHYTKNSAGQVKAGQDAVAFLSANVFEAAR